MRVEIEGDARIRVTEQFRDDLRMDTLTEEEGGRCVPQVMKPNSGYAGSLQQLREGAVQEVRCVDRPATTIREDKIVVFPVGRGGSLQLLTSLMFGERGCRELAD